MDLPPDLPLEIDGQTVATREGPGLDFFRHFRDGKMTKKREQLLGFNRV